MFSNSSFCSGARLDALWNGGGGILSHLCCKAHATLNLQVLPDLQPSGSHHRKPDYASAFLNKLMSNPAVKDGIMYWNNILNILENLLCVRFVSSIVKSSAAREAIANHSIPFILPHCILFPRMAYIAAISFKNSVRKSASKTHRKLTMFSLKNDTYSNQIIDLILGH